MSDRLSFPNLLMLFRVILRRREDIPPTPLPIRDTVYRYSHATRYVSMEQQWARTRMYYGLCRGNIAIAQYHDEAHLALAFAHQTLAWNLLEQSDRDLWYWRTSRTGLFNQEAGLPIPLCSRHQVQVELCDFMRIARTGETVAPHDPAVWDNYCNLRSEQGEARAIPLFMEELLSTDFERELRRRHVPEEEEENGSVILETDEELEEEEEPTPPSPCTDPCTRRYCANGCNRRAPTPELSIRERDQIIDRVLAREEPIPVRITRSRYARMIWTCTRSPPCTGEQCNHH